jgi:hypothetical protein
LVAGVFAGATLAVVATAYAQEHHEGLVRALESALLHVDVSGGAVAVTTTNTGPIAVATKTPNVFRFVFTPTPGLLTEGDTTQFTNTSGQLLVLDQLSVTTDGPLPFVATIHSGSEGYENYFQFPPPTGNWIALNQLIKLYLLPGDSLSTRGGTNGTTISYSWSGHYE